MHRRLIEEGFNRRYVLLPLLLSIGLVVSGFVVTEMRRDETRLLAETLRQRQDVMRVLAEAVYESLEAESAQRGFLLTGEAKYLPPLETGLAASQDRLRQLIDRFATLAPVEVPVLKQALADLIGKGEEMRRTVQLLQQGQPHRSLDMVKSDVGLYLMMAIRQSLEGVRTRERERIFKGIDRWTDSTRLNTIINFLGTLFTLVVLLVLGLLASRDLRRREVYAAQLAGEIEMRTRELRELSQHMSRVVELEKYALARELHDELGGLLVSMRMDISQLRKRAGFGQDPDIAARWARVDQALADGLDLKNRVIETLRPTLLDNMGVFSAVRWMANQSAEQAGLYLKMEGMEEDIELPAETSIAVFRTAQEAIANIIRHAQARRISIKATVGERLSIEIADDGKGMPEGAEQRSGSHGMKQMRFRMEAVGGTLGFDSNELGGTTVRLSVAVSATA
jgi:signal transduction histidine kinase